MLITIFLEIKVRADRLSTQARVTPTMSLSIDDSPKGARWWSHISDEASFAILFASPAFRSSSWSVADWTASGHILRNSCHSEVSVTMARARTQNIHHLLLFCWTCSVGPHHFCCWCGRQLVTDWQQLVSMFQAIWGKTACRMPAQAKITSVQLGGREVVHLPDSCHHTICRFKQENLSKITFRYFTFCLMEKWDVWWDRNTTHCHTC